MASPIPLARRLETLRLADLTRFPLLLVTFLLLVERLPLRGAALKLRHLGVPGAIANGSDVWLNCAYETEHYDSLYSVKWYKNNIEFYRFMEPENELYSAEKKFFPQPGLFVDTSKSNATHVYLHTTDLNTEGTFGCEVSLEEPSFQSIKAEADLRIYVKPAEKLQLIGVKSEYHVGDLVKISCVSAASKPAAILAWFVNGNRIFQSEQNLNLSWIVMDSGQEGLSVSIMNISFYITNDKSLFDGALTIFCSSSISQILGVTFEELVVEEHGLYTRLNEYSEGYPTKVESSDQLVPPQIHGISSRYVVGGKLDVNCTSTDSHPSPFLEWYVNGKQVTSAHFVSYSEPIPYNNQQARKFTNSPYDSFATFARPVPVATTLGLRFTVAKEHYQTVDGAMRLKCVSIHAKIFHEESAGLELLSDGRTNSLLLTKDGCARNLLQVSTWSALAATHLLYFYLTRTRGV